MARALEVKLGGTLKLLFEEVETKAGIFVTLQYDSFKLKVRGDEMGYTLPADKTVGVQVSYVDANGNPATVDGDVTWDSSDEDIAYTQVDPADSTKAWVRPGTKIGQAQITATADADLGDGTRELITLMDVQVVGGEAVAGTITPVGEPGPIATPKA